MIPLERTPQVWGIVGNLGGGKTLTSVSMAIEAIRDGYFVVSNITIDVDLLSKTIPWARELYLHVDVVQDEYDETGNLVKHEDFNPFSLPSGSPRGSRGNKRVLVILDECAEWFDQYTSARSSVLKRVMSWLRHTSKRSQDVLFIVQRREYLNKSFRLLVSRWISVDDLAVFRIPVLKIHIPFCKDFVMANVFDRTNNRIGNPRLIRKSDYGRYYNTAECLASGNTSAVEYSSPKRSYSFPLFLFLFFLAELLFMAYL